MNSNCVHILVAPVFVLAARYTRYLFTVVGLLFIRVSSDSTVPRAVRNRCRVSNTVNPASMELGQLLALPRQSLVLLASARHLVTTGSKARLAERIHAFEHAIPPPAGSTDAVGTNNITPPPLPVTVNEDSLTANAFSEVQITQLRSLISAAVHSERVGSQHHPVPVEGSLLSPVTPQLQSPSRATQTGLQNIQINPAPNNNFSAGAEQHGVGPSSTLGSNPPPANLIGTPGTSAPSHNLPPLPQKFYSGSPNVSTLILLINWPTTYTLTHLWLHKISIWWKST